MSSTDTQFFNEIRLGNTEAFEYVFHKYYPRLCQYAFTLVKQREIAEEVVENVFVKLWEDRDVLSISVSFRAYLYKAVYNQCVSHLKHSKTRFKYAPEPMAEEKAATVLTVSPASSVEMSILKELEEEICKSVESLPEQCREIFKLCRYEEMQYVEIALHLNISINTVKTQMRKAMTKLSQAFRDYLPMTLIGMSTVVLGEVANISYTFGLI